MKKVALYCRVSTEKQEEQKTIKSQIAELREICKNFEIVEEYLDNGYSGESLDRPSLDCLRRDVKKGLFEAVYVHSVDRLSRNLYQQGIIVEEFKKANIEIFIGDKPISDTPEGRFMFNVLGATAEYEKERILERTRRGRIFKAKQKGIVGSTPPFGYDYIKKTPEKEGYYKINKKEAEIVILMFDFYIKFQSLSRVVKELTLKGIKPRKGGIKWNNSVVGRILRNESCVGTGYYCKNYSVETENGKKYKRTIKTGRRKRDRSEWIPIKFPVIISKEKFRFVQKLLSKNYKPYADRKHFYLLSGLIKCKLCGSSFTGETVRSHQYYRCNNRHKKFPFPKDCNAKMVRVNQLDNSVWTAVSNAVKNPKILISGISLLTKKVIENQKLLEKEEKDWSREKEKIDYKKDKLLELYTEGNIPKELFLKKISELTQIEKELEDKIKENESKLTQAVSKPMFIEAVKHFSRLVMQRLESITPEQKQQFLNCILDKIILDSRKGEAWITGYVPVDNQRLVQMFPIEDGVLSPPLISSACLTKRLKSQKKELVQQ